MPRAYYKPCDLDPPILKGKELGFSPEEIAAALGIPIELVNDRIAAAHARSVPLPMVKVAPKEVWRPRDKQSDPDPRRAAWERARKGAAMTREGLL